MILHGFSPVWGLPDSSPFVIKVDCYLRMAGLKYTFQRLGQDGLESYPQKKAPYMEIDGEKIGDSAHILSRLEKDVGLDAHLTPEQRAVGTLLTRALEKDVYLQLIQNRWLTHFEPYTDDLAGAAGVPKQFMQPFFLAQQERYRQMLHQDGAGRHRPAFADDNAVADFEAASVLLKDKKFLFGDKPSTYDATLYGFVAIYLKPPMPCAVKDRVKKMTNLVKFMERIEGEYYKQS